MKMSLSDLMVMFQCTVDSLKFVERNGIFMYDNSTRSAVVDRFFQQTANYTIEINIDKDNTKTALDE